MQISLVLTVYSGGCHRWQTWLDERHSDMSTMVLRGGGVERDGRGVSK